MAQAVREAAQAESDERRGLTEQTQRRIGTHLRAMYEGLVQQPVPDRFRELIEKLDSADRS
ncbi:NepR family anti-sigma factor [Methylobacterium sp. sgz302541]|uniref:NepR family anti-sigma factor n=1 Tax=unclassified Methylobacterium TaxID=2615210 RepID=UPI003D32BC2A